MRFSYSYRPRYSGEELIKILQEFRKTYKRPPRMEDMNKAENMPDASTFAAYFGTWNKALEAAGIEKLQWKYNDDELLDKFIELYDKKGRIPTKTEMEYAKKFPAVRSFVSRFGSWEKAIELAMYRKFILDQEKDNMAET